MMESEHLLAGALLVPFAMLLACIWPRALDRMPSYLLFAPMPALATVFLVTDDTHLLVGSTRLHLNFALDLPGALLLGAAALLWIASGAYARPYLKSRPNRGRFVVSWLMTLTGCIGVFLAADMIGFYLFLALLTLGACGLIIYHDTSRAWRAGAVYIGVGLLAESLLLVAFVMLAAQTPGHSLLIRDAAATLPASPHRDLILALLLTGFGIKAGLVPFYFWMPLAYRAAPTPAAAVLSGAVVKASILGMIRFLPLDTTVPDWGTTLAAAGFFAAIYGVVIGIAQRDPRIVLAYSSVSQLGVMVAVIGMGMVAGDGRAALATAGYATNHILVKGALFLSVGVIAATGRKYLWLMLLPTALIAVGLGGLPLTGGGLAKLVVDGPLGDGTASILATVSSVGTTVLMLHFLRSVLNNVSQDPEAKAAAGLVVPWLAVAAASIILPWTLFLAMPIETLPNPLAPATVWKALWPVLLGAVLAIALWKWPRWSMRIPEEKVTVAESRAARGVLAYDNAVERLDRAFRSWPVAGMSLLVLILTLGAAVTVR
jgi:formate hydrogenlyase subunit 3/multisubunit Na+/H+ antiporter MnhD subunit